MGELVKVERINLSPSFMSVYFILFSTWESQQVSVDIIPPSVLPYLQWFNQDRLVSILSSTHVVQSHIHFVSYSIYILISQDDPIFLIFILAYTPLAS